jgi:hypothetical protein
MFYYKYFAMLQVGDLRQAVESVALHMAEAVKSVALHMAEAVEAGC